MYEYGRQAKKKKGRGGAFLATIALFAAGGTVATAISGDIRSENKPECAGLELPQSATCYWLKDGAEANAMTLPTTVVAAPPAEVQTAPVLSPARPPGECPLNGSPYSPQDQAEWEVRRPLNIIIENSEPSRNQSGLSSADIVIEAKAEFDITRFDAVMYCQKPGVIVGPLRSARQVTLDMAQAYGNAPVYVHVGGSTSQNPELNALQRIIDVGWGGHNDMDSVTEGDIFYRDKERLNRPSNDEHTMYSSTDRLWALAAIRGLTNIDARTGLPWQEGFVPYTAFNDDAPLEQRSGAQTIFVPFGGQDPGQNVEWRYDQTSNTYLRFNGGEPHHDMNNGEHLAPKNVVIMYVNETPNADGSHTMHETVGTGSAQVFMNGHKVDATWERPSQTSQPVLKDSSGNILNFTKGQIWIQLVGNGTPVAIS